MFLVWVGPARALKSASEANNIVADFVATFLKLKSGWWMVKKGESLSSFGHSARSISRAAVAAI